MNIFKMVYNKISDDFIEIEKFPETINRRAVLLSEFQYINKDMESVKVSSVGGIEFPDYLEENGFNLFSDKLKSILDRENIQNIFYKPIMLIDDDMNRKELYWLAISDRIECLDEKLSIYDKELSYKVLIKTIIDIHRIGNYHVFQIKEE